MTEHSTPQRAGPRVALFLDRSGGANPADAAGVNINKIMAVFKKTGTLPNVQLSNPLYGDFTNPEDIHSIREAVHEAEDRFAELPAKVRALCENDWVQFLERFDDPDGQKTLLDAGLTIGPPPVTTPPIQGVQEATAPKTKTPPEPEDKATTTSLTSASKG